MLSISNCPEQMKCFILIYFHELGFVIIGWKINGMSAIEKLFKVPFPLFTMMYYYNYSLLNPLYFDNIQNEHNSSIMQAI